MPGQARQSKAKQGKGGQGQGQGQGRARAGKGKGKAGRGRARPGKAGQHRGACLYNELLQSQTRTVVFGLDSSQTSMQGTNNDRTFSDALRHRHTHTHTHTPLLKAPLVSVWRRDARQGTSTRGSHSCFLPGKSGKPMSLYLRLENNYINKESIEEL